MEKSDAYYIRAAQRNLLDAIDNVFAARQNLARAGGPVGHIDERYRKIAKKLYEEVDVLSAVLLGDMVEEKKGALASARRG